MPELNHNELIRSVSEELLPMFFSMMAGVEKLKFDEQHLKRADDLINEMYPLGHKPLPTTFIPFGILLGETIIRNIPNAKWLMECESPFDMEVQIQNITSGTIWRINPFGRVNRYWFDRSRTLACMYRTLDYLSKVVDIDNPEKRKMLEDDDGWIKFPNGDAIEIGRDEQITKRNS